ncbi:MAK10-like protein [Tanacetum coccineum]
MTSMGDENPMRTLGDYSKPSHEGYQNTIELPEGNNVVPLRSDTIRLVQNECSFHGLRSEDPNQHLKDFLKLMDSIDLDVANRERTRLRSISTWEDLNTGFLAQFFPPRRTTKLRNDILMFQQHQRESISEAWTCFKDLLQKVPHHGIDLWLQVQIFYDHVNPVTRRTIDQSVGGKLCDRNAKESWALLEDLALYENESWNDPRDFAKLVKEISLHQDVLSASDLVPTTLSTAWKIPSKLLLLSKLLLIKYASSRTDEAGEVGTQQAKEPERTLEDEFQDLHLNLPILEVEFMDCHLPGEWEIARDAEINPFKDVLVFRRMVEFLGAIPINLKRNMWESEDLIENPINWDKPPKNRDGAWHAKIRLIDPDGEELTKTFSLVPTSRKLFERESPREIIDLDHFYDT